MAGQPKQPVTYVAFRRLRGNPGMWQATDMKGTRTQVLSQISALECQALEEWEYAVVPKGEKPELLPRRYMDRMMRPGG